MFKFNYERDIEILEEYGFHIMYEDETFNKIVGYQFGSMGCIYIDAKTRIVDKNTDIMPNLNKKFNELIELGYIVEDEEND